MESHRGGRRTVHDDVDSADTTVRPTGTDDIVRPGSVAVPRDANTTTGNETL
jgi:hypothetical protein